MKQYTENHEWVALEGDVAVVGITEHAAEQLGDIVFAELPQVGSEFSMAECVAVLESAKAASDIYTPCGGEVVAINEVLEDDPELVNRDPEVEGWLFKIKCSDTKELDALMDKQAYEDFLQ